MYAEAISDSLWELLRRLNRIADMKSSYLGGGTALAIQMGHRMSDDLDFFVTGGFDYAAFKTRIEQAGLDALVLNQSTRHVGLMIRSTKVDLIREQISLKFPLKPLHPDIETLRMADPRDIARMKLMSIGGRGSKKDFVDIYCLAKEIITLESLITAAAEEGRGLKYSRLLFLKGLVDFEEADKDSDLNMIWNVSWEDVKMSLMQEVKRIAKKME